jgi:acyl-CoA reductase-like NAD-dependent aldehyde dehydrogenase
VNAIAGGDTVAAALPSGDLFVGGQWRPGRGDEVASTYPADGSLNRTVRLASVEDVDEAVDRAVAARSTSGWADLLPMERAAVLHRIGDELRASVDRISWIQTRDTGKTLAETRALALSAAGTFRYMAAALETLDDALTAPRGQYMTMSTWEPIGVVAAVTPWNSPIASDAQKVAPALAAGNAVILKPATWTPLVALELAAICQRAGLPDGLLSVLPGHGGEIGDRLVRHPAIGKVSFTGGTVTGRRVAMAAAERLMPVSLELGGKSPTVVFEDADLEHAVAGVLYGIFSSTGQSCIAGSRLFVHRGIYERFVELLVDRTRRLRVGEPTDPATQVAPLVHVDHRSSVEEYVQLARDEGGVVLTGGGRPTGDSYERGAYYEPTIVAGLHGRARVCQEEIFGPVLVVLPFGDEDDLVEQANDSVFGLACGLWTGDYRTAWRVAHRIDAGTVYINTYKQLSIATPFGGMKSSGIGREKGRDGLRAYMRQKSLYWGLNREPLPWAGQ